MMILVVGATGTVGSHVTEKLLEQGEQVRCLVRSEEKRALLPAGVEGVIGDLEQPETLKEVFSGIEGVFLLNALSQNETEQGLAAIDAAKRSGVTKVVYLSVPMPEGSQHIPHFKTKVAVEQALLASGMTYTILRPNNFFQNDYWFQEALVNYGVYPQPLGEQGLNRIDVRDIADAAVNALTSTEFDDQSYLLYGLDALTSLSTVDVFSRHMGREITHAGDNLDAWAEQAKTMMPDWMVEDLKVMYQYFQDHGLVATQQDLLRQQKIIGHSPRRFEEFVAEMAVSIK